MSNRWNGQPSEHRSSNTPDPTNAGWTYQGSNNTSKVEFYAKGNTKMDYYPTTGTVKTSMDHPSKGHTQLFRRGLTESEFHSVAMEPRSHTGKGYYTKK